MEGACPNPELLKRGGVPLDGPGRKSVKIGDAAEWDLEDHAFAARRAIGSPDAELAVTLTPERLRRTGQDPNRGRPAYDAMRPMGNPQKTKRQPAFASENYRNLDENPSRRP